MTHVPYNDELLKNLNGKIAIITGISPPKLTLIAGGAQGIGAQAVEIFVAAGATVVFADMNVQGGKSVEQQVHGKATFRETDISSWASVRGLFKWTFEKYGRIDVVAANAGIHGHEPWLEDLVDEDGELGEPQYPAITVNLIGMLYSFPLLLEKANLSIEIGVTLFRQEPYSRGRFDDHRLSIVVL
jgi:NAD(P)-dependent dehydrogenase (short-subunit alcohol dehydrogenase family)